MRETLDYYIQIILVERYWSWQIIALVYFVLALIIRSWFLKPLVQRAKILDKRHFLAIKSEYKTNALWGWVFLLGSIGLVSVAWYQTPSWEMSIQQIVIILTAVLCFFLSILFHLIAFGLAAIEAMRKTANEQLIA